jgi:4-hydroxybenzoate polyprenyltransferase/phosphoserine phosphatase
MVRHATSPVPVAATSGLVPLCVDLDGTLIQTDLLWESFVRLMAQKPYLLFAVPFWLLRGRAVLKRQLAMRVTLDCATLPYHQPFLEYLRAAREKGSRLILVTASDMLLAERVAKHLGLFDEVLASDGALNLRGQNKAKVLVERFGVRGFDYAGNSSADLPVWSETREAIVVNAGPGLARQAADRTRLGQTFLKTRSTWSTWLEALRPHQWAKNVIVFLPLLTAHEIFDGPLLLAAFQAFVAFCLCASGVYVFNDLLDLDADRHHPTKCRRPFASGALPLSAGVILFPMLLAAGLIVAGLLNAPLMALMAFYFVTASVYSLRLKRVAMLDVVVLAGLYTLRIIAGHLATGVAYSAWLLVFSMFIFLSLALLKRFKELQSVRAQNEMDAKGRGYRASDLELVATLGLVNGYLAVLVLALYVNSPQVVALYQHPLLLLLVCPMLLYWISRIWFLAHRGQMHVDPVLFALKDWPSYVIGILTVAVLWFATGH